MRVGALPPTDVFSLQVFRDTIAAGMDTSVFVSTDGGATWHGSTRPSPDAKVIDALFFRNHRLFAGTFGAGVFVSDDLGATWHAFNEGLVGGFLNSQLSIADLEPRGDELVAATFGDGVFVRNIAVADTWHPFGDAFEPNQAANVDDIGFGLGRLLACAGSNGEVFRRDLGQADWTVSFLDNIGLEPGLSALSSVFTGSGWVVGTSSGVFFSADGQEPWTPSSTRMRGISWATFAPIGSLLFAAFDSVNTVLFDESIDGGATWIRRETVNAGFAYQIAFHDGDLFAARSDGLWIQRGATASVDGRELHPFQFSLAGPQPVHDAAHFRFDLPQPASTVLEVFDVSGRRAMERIEHAWPAGPHELTVSAGGLPPGVYAARLTAGPRRETLRFIRVR